MVRRSPHWSHGSVVAGALGQRVRLTTETSMKTIRGPAIFLAQFAGDAPPFNSLAGMAGWAPSLGFSGGQIPAWDARLFDLAEAAARHTSFYTVTGTLPAPPPGG